MKFVPASDRSLLVVLGQGISVETNARVHVLSRSLQTDNRVTSISPACLTVVVQPLLTTRRWSLTARPLRPNPEASHTMRSSALHKQPQPGGWPTGITMTRSSDNALLTVSFSPASSQILLAKCLEMMPTPPASGGVRRKRS